MRMSPLERLRERLSWRFVVRALRAIHRDPALLLRRLTPSHPRPVPATSPVVVRPPRPARGTKLGLETGDRVRVRSVEEIQRTLDARGRCDGLAYIPSVMDRFSGGVFRVRRRVAQFFDERERRMLRVRDVVILEQVFCEPLRDDLAGWGGCDRSCFLFWKEAWLEREPARAEESYER
jgi:hypothetical protein